MTRDSILERYRHLRAISTQHHETALSYLSRHAIADQAKRLRLLRGRSLVVDSDQEITLAFDLALYAAPEGRSRAVDRYARAAKLAFGSDEALVLDAMRHARFSIWRVEERHEVVGLILVDLLREEKVWVVDESLQESADEGLMFASRLCVPDSFAMTCGVLVPINEDLIEQVMVDTFALQHDDPGRLAQDPRFATAIYRAAIDTGLMERVQYQEAPSSASMLRSEGL